MMKKGFWVLIFSLLMNGWSSAIAATFTLQIPTNSGVIVREVTSFDQSSLTAIEAYNYTNARYNGIVPINPGTNMFFVDTLDGLALFMVNEAAPTLVGQLKYEITTQGDLLFRDDILAIDYDPIEIMPHPDSTTTFISYEGYVADDDCLMNNICRTDGLVIGLTSPNPKDQVIRWGYDLSYPMKNIPSINFWSSNDNENFSVELGTEANQFNPEVGEVVAKQVVIEIPESSLLWGLFGFAIASFAVYRH